MSQKEAFNDLYMTLQFTSCMVNHSHEFSKMDESYCHRSVQKERSSQAKEVTQGELQWGKKQLLELLTKFSGVAICDVPAVVSLDSMMCYVCSQKINKIIKSKKQLKLSEDAVGFTWATPYRYLKIFQLCATVFREGSKKSQAYKAVKQFIIRYICKWLLLVAFNMWYQMLWTWCNRLQLTMNKRLFATIWHLLESQWLNILLTKILRSCKRYCQ